MPATYGDSTGIAGQNSIVVTKPAGVVAGDRLITLLYHDEVLGTPPDGWALLHTTADDAVNSSRVRIYHRLADGTEPASWTWVRSGTVSTSMVGQCYRIPGGGVPTVTSALTPSGTTHTAAATTAPTGSLVIPFWAASGFTNSVATTWTTSAATEQEDQNDGWLGLMSATSTSGAAKAATASRTTAGIAGQIVVPEAAAAPSGAGAPAYRAGSVTALANGTRTSSAVPVPVGVQNDDIVLVYLYAEESAPTFTPPANQGWAALAFPDVPLNTTSTNGLHIQRVFWKRQVAGHPTTGSYAFTHASAITHGAAAAFTGAITTGTPVEVIDSAIENARTAAVPPVFGNTAGPDRLLVYGLTFYSWLAEPLAPSGWTAIRVLTGNTDEGLVIASKAQAAAGATGNVASPNVTSGTNTNWLATLIALVPASTASAAALSSDGDLTAGVTDPTVEQSGGLSGAGTLTAVTRPVIVRDTLPDLSGSGTLSATGRPVVAQAAQLGGAGTLTVATTARATQAAQLSGSGTLVALANAARLSSTGTLTVTTLAQVAQAAQLSSAGALTSIIVIRPQLSGAGQLDAATRAAVARVAALGGVGSLTARSAVFHQTGSGTLLAVVAGVRFAAVHGPITGVFDTDGVHLGVFVSHVGAA